MESTASLVLICDSSDIRETLLTALSNAGFRVFASRSMTEGLRKIYENLPDVVLMEDRLSRKDSVDFCYQVGQLSGFPLVLLGDEGLSSIGGFERGADYYASRPFEVPELTARIKSLLRRQGERFKEVRLFLNVDDRTALVGRRTVKLTRTEFRLLACIMMGSGRFVPVADLLSQIWPGKRVTEDSVRFYVSRLREKMDSESRYVILNRRGVGYRVVEQTQSGSF